MRRVANAGGEFVGKVETEPLCENAGRISGDRNGDFRDELDQLIAQIGDSDQAGTLSEIHDIVLTPPVIFIGVKR